jgi:hypothetical protein
MIFPKSKNHFKITTWNGFTLHFNIHLYANSFTAGFVIEILVKAKFGFGESDSRSRLTCVVTSVQVVNRLRTEPPVRKCNISG